MDLAKRLSYLSLHLQSAEMFLRKSLVSIRLLPGTNEYYFAEYCENSGYIFPKRVAVNDEYHS